MAKGLKRFIVSFLFYCASSNLTLNLFDNKILVMVYEVTEKETAEYLNQWWEQNTLEFVVYVSVSASPLSGWNPTITNVTDTSFAVQWPLLTGQISQPVSAYVVFVNWTTINEGHEMTGRIVPSNVTSATIRRMPSFRSYQAIVIAVDTSGRPFNSSSVYVRTLEGG